MLQGESQSSWWEASLSYIKSILTVTLHSTGFQSLYLPDRCTGLCFSLVYFSEGKPDPTAYQCHQWPCPPMSFNPISPPFRNALQTLIFILLFSPGCGALGRLGGSEFLDVPDLFTLFGETGYRNLLCVHWSHPRLLSGTCQRSRTRWVSQSTDDKGRTIGHNQFLASSAVPSSIASLIHDVDWCRNTITSIWMCMLMRPCLCSFNTVWHTSLWWPNLSLSTNVKKYGQLHGRFLHYKRGI